MSNESGGIEATGTPPAQKETTFKEVSTAIDNYRQSFSTETVKGNPEGWYEKYEQAREEIFRVLLDIYPEEKRKFEELVEGLENATYDEILETVLRIRKKYDFPTREIHAHSKEYDPTQYWGALIKIAEENNIPVKEFDRKKSGIAFGLGFYSPEHKTVYTMFDPESPYQSAYALEHELTHAFQGKRYPRMSLAEQEFEALIVGEKYFLDLKGKPYFNVEGFTSRLTNCLCNDLILDFEEKHLKAASR